MRLSTLITILGAPYRAPGSYGYWVFNKGDSRNLTSINSQSRTLALQGAAPTYSGNYLSLPNLPGAALLTDIADSSATPRDTFCAIVRAPELARVRILMGSLTTLGGGNDGASPYISAADNKFYINCRGAFASSALTAALTANTWYFVAMSRDFGGAGANSTRWLIGGLAASENLNAVGAFTPSATGKIACGNAYYNSSEAGVTDYAQFTLFQYAMTLGELATLYDLQKRAAARDGIIVV